MLTLFMDFLLKIRLKSVAFKVEDCIIHKRGSDVFKILLNNSGDIKSMSINDGQIYNGQIRHQEWEKQWRIATEQDIANALAERLKS